MKAQTVAFERAKANAKENPEIDRNERLNKGMSLQEYEEKYDLDNSDVFQQQAQSLHDYERCITLIQIAFETMKVKSWGEFHEIMEQKHQEGGHFKNYLRSKINDPES